MILDLVGKASAARISTMRAGGSSTVFSGSACEGYTTGIRWCSSELESGEDMVTETELSSTTWEEGSGKSYRFKIDARMNDADSSPVAGVAERTGDHIIGQAEAALKPGPSRSTAARYFRSS